MTKSKSFFERRIFGEEGSADAVPRQAPSLGSLKSAEQGAQTSQPYRFRGGQPDHQPAIRAADTPPRAPRHAAHDTNQFTASDELRTRLGLSHRERAMAERQAPPQDQYAGLNLDDEEAEFFDEVRHTNDFAQEEVDPYPLSAPQPQMPVEDEATFGFYAQDEQAIAPEPDLDPVFEDEYDEPAPMQAQLRAAPVAPQATHAQYHQPTPASSVAQPQVTAATDTAVPVGPRVNLSDQRSGASVQPELYVSSDDRIGSQGQGASARQGQPQRAKTKRNLFAGFGAKKATASAPRKQAAPQKRPVAPQAQGTTMRQKPKRQPVRVTGAAAVGAPRQPQRRDGGETVFGWFRNGAMVLASLLGVMFFMSVSYAAFQRIGGGNANQDVPIILAPQTPAKLTPAQAGLDPDFAAGRSFEDDLTVLSNPLGVLEPSDDRYASDGADAPTLTMDFGGNTLIIPQVNGGTGQAQVFDPMESIIAASATVDPLAANPSVAGLNQPITGLVAPQGEEPLAALAPLANGLRDLPTPNRRIRVPSNYRGIQAQAQTVQATTPTVTATPSLTQSTTNSQVAGARGATGLAIDPAAGLPVRPVAPSLSGSAVVAPYGIQLASLRTEQQANVLWKRLQDKHPELLGGLASRVVRFESGSRGVFYRLQAGPMASKATALDFCIRLKTAGQECIFVRG